LKSRIVDWRELTPPAKLSVPWWRVPHRSENEIRVSSSGRARCDAVANDVSNFAQTAACLSAYTGLRYRSRMRRPCVPALRRPGGVGATVTVAVLAVLVAHIAETRGTAMSIGLILVIILIIFLLGGFSGRFGGYGYGYGHRGVSLIGIIVIILVVLLLMGRI
jgi:hypothetical protein